MEINSSFDLQKYVPAWDNGKLFEKEGHYFFEEQPSGDTTALSEDVAEIAKLFDGEKTVRQVIELHCKHVRKVEFRKVLHSLRILAENSFLKDSSALVQFFKDPNAQRRLATGSPVPTLLKEQIFTPSFGTPAPVLFWALTLIATASGIISSLISWPKSFPADWLRINETYMTGLLVIWICHSFTLSLQAILQSLAIRFATGILPGVFLQITPLHISLSVDEKYLYESLGRAKDTIILLFSVFSPVFVFGWIVWMLPSSLLRDHLSVFIPFYLLFYLDPYRRSPVTHFFQKLISHQKTVDLLPFLKKRALIAIKAKTDLVEEKVLVFYSTFAILWSFAAYSIVTRLAENNIANLWLALNHDSLTSKIAAAVLAFLLLSTVVYVIFEIASTLLMNLIQPILSPFYQLKKKVKTKETNEFPAAVVLEKLSNTLLFNGLPESALGKISALAKAWRLSPKTRLIVQGEVGKKIFVILKGSLRIEKRSDTGRTITIAELGEGAAIGESALTARNKRTADVVSIGECVVAVFDAEEIKKSLSAEELELILQKIMISQYISKSDLFKNLPEEASSIFSTKGKLKDYSAGSDILTQGNVGKEFYLLLRGKVEVMRDHVKVSELTEGNFFGEIAMVANVERTATVRAIEKTSVLEISSDDFWDILTGNIGLATYIEAIADLRMESVEQLHLTQDTVSHAH